MPIPSNVVIVTSTDSDLIIKSGAGASTAADTDIVIWTPATGKRIRLYRLFISGVAVLAAVPYRVYDVTTEILRVHTQILGQTLIIDFTPFGYKFAAVNTTLRLQHGDIAARILSFTAMGVEE